MDQWDKELDRGDQRKRLLLIPDADDSDHSVDLSKVYSDAWRIAGNNMLLSKDLYSILLHGVIPESGLDIPLEPYVPRLCSPFDPRKQF